VSSKAGHHVNREEKKFLPLLGFEPRTVQSLANLYTQYVLSPPNKQITILLHGVSNFVPDYADEGEALRYKSGGRGFDSRWCHWNFSLT